MIVNLDEMFIERLKAYEAKAGSGKYPQSIIFVRDGKLSYCFLSTIIDV